MLQVIERRLVDVDRLTQAAVTAEDDVGRCCGWLAVERQAEGYLRALQVRARAWPPGLAERLSAVRGDLEDRAAEARRSSGAFGAEVRAEARAGLGLRVAVVGKGGSGKTVVAGTLARLLARRGRQVLAADLDGNPGLAYTVGLGPTEAGLPGEALQEDPGAAYGWDIAAGLTPVEAVRRFASMAPDGVRYLGVGKVSAADRDTTKRSVVAVNTVLREFGEPGWDVIGDLEGGPTTPFERYHSFADLVILVAGPSWVSGLTVRRLLPMVDDTATMVVFNRVEGGAHHDGIVPVLRIPADPAVIEAERRGVAPIDHCPDAPAVRAIDELADLLTPKEVPV